MPDGYTLVHCNTEALPAAAIDDAIAILRSGGAVDVNAARLGIPAATVLFFLHHHDKLAGLGAIKESRPQYNLKIRKKSGYELDSSMLELGYVAIGSEHRGQRLSGKIVDALLAAYDGALFSTTDDKLMKSTLTHRGFDQRGTEWTGDRKPLSLWLRKSGS